MKNYQQTPKERRMQKRKVEAAKRAVAHSKPHFDPRESWSTKRKIGGVPVSVLACKQRSVPYDAYGYRFWF